MRHAASATLVASLRTSAFAPVLAVLATFVFTFPASAQARGETPEPLSQALASLEFREIGPAIMGGRVADLAADPNDAATFYVGFSIGGLWKTTSQGLEWTPLFDDQTNSSIGAVSLAPSNAQVVWVGTGEPQNRQSTPYGDGVYRSLDGGKTWEHKGLVDTRHVARIVIHPTNPDVVYVAAVGQLSAPNEERGVFRTVDGGVTWEKVLYVDERTGAIDLVMHPTDPKTLFAAMYQRQRTPWGFSADGDGSGLYRTLDGGATWHELTEGLPEGYKGRMGLDVYRGDGSLVYALVESRDDGRGLYRSRDRGDTWAKVSDRNPRPMYFSLVRIDPTDPERIYLGGVQFSISDDGGRTWRDGDQADGIHVDHHALLIHPANPNHLILGNDGGVATSWDRGETWRHHANMAVGQFYQIGLDNGDPYKICGGLQDNYSWCGPSQTLSNHGIMNRDWLAIHGGDGFFNVPDPTDPDIVYTESQNGNVGRFHYTAGETARIRPEARPTPDDTARDYRWNWNTPIHVSHHDPATVYVGANHLLRSPDRGQSWHEASPDVTRQIDRDTLAIMDRDVTDETLSRNDGVSMYGTIVEIGESPLDPDVLYVGTDDAMLQVTRDGGETWTDITGAVPGLEHGMVVSHVEPSAHEEGRVYVAYDGHWSSDYRPHVYVSEDFGETWRAIENGLPRGATVNVLREHPRAPNLVFLGNEVGLYATFDRGERWEKLHGANFPTVPVDDLRIHPREHDLVVATHGRSIWILDDIAPLEEIARDDVLASDAHLFPVRRATMWRRKGIYGFWGHGVFQAPNPPDGAVIRYWLAHDIGDDEVTLEVVDGAGEVVRTLEGTGDAGMQQISWDLRTDPPFEVEGGGGFGFGGPPRGVRVFPGDFTVRLAVGVDTMTTGLAVREDPRIDVPRADLVARNEALARVNDLAEPLFRAGEAMDEVEERLEAARILLEAAGEGESETLLEELDALEAHVEVVQDDLSEARSGRQVQFAIDGVSARPTEDQLWRIERGEAAGPGAIRALNDLLTERLPAFEARIYQPAARPAPIEPVALAGGG